MNDLKWWKIMFFMVLATMLIMGVIASVHTSGLKTRNLELIELNTYLEEQALSSNFAWIACDMEIDNLEQIIASKDELILELRVQEEVLGHTKEMLEYSLTYIHFVQVVMEKNGIVYPEFIIESILTDDFLEDGVEDIE